MVEFLSLAALVSAAIVAPPAEAQVEPARAPGPALINPALQTLKTPDVQWRAFQTRNVAPSLMAFWLDSAHNTLMARNQGVKPTWAIGRSAVEMQAMLSLPEGVQLVTSLDSQNILWVLGTPSGLQRASEKIGLLDQPLQQVEVEAQYVQISAADAKTLQINFAPASAPGRGKIEVGQAGANIQAQIEKLVAQKRAKILTAPRVLALFGQNLR